MVSTAYLLLLVSELRLVWGELGFWVPQLIETAVAYNNRPGTGDLENRGTLFLGLCNRGLTLNPEP